MRTDGARSNRGWIGPHPFSGVPVRGLVLRRSTTVPRAEWRASARCRCSAASSSTRSRWRRRTSWTTWASSRAGSSVATALAGAATVVGRVVFAERSGRPERRLPAIFTLVRGWIRGDGAGRHPCGPDRRCGPQLRRHRSPAALAAHLGDCPSWSTPSTAAAPVCGRRRSSSDCSSARSSSSLSHPSSQASPWPSASLASPRWWWRRLWLALHGTVAVAERPQP